MNDERMFPVLWQGNSRDFYETLKSLGCPREVPWAMLSPHEARAVSNHEQSLHRLATRGGLSPAEMMCVLEDRKLFPLIENDIAAVPRLLEFVAQWKKRQKVCNTCGAQFVDISVTAETWMCPNCVVIFMDGR